MEEELKQLFDQLIDKVIDIIKPLSVDVQQTIVEKLYDIQNKVCVYVKEDTNDPVEHTENNAPNNKELSDVLSELELVRMEPLKFNANQMSYHTACRMSDTESIDQPKAIPTEKYDYINPSHYKRYPKESIDMIEDIFGIEKTIDFCIINAFKYRMRMGTKPEEPIERDLEKEIWYLNKAKELKNKLTNS